MTENEALELMESLVIDTKCDLVKTLDFKTTVIRALEDLQQYIAIGTVEELKSMKENGAFTGVELAQLAAMQMRLKEYSAIGTIEEFKALKEHMKIIQEAYENTDGYKDGYAKAIDEFSERLKERIVGMQMAELQGEDICPCAENGKECPYINQDIGCQYCAREHTIKEIDEIAEEMRGAE